MISRRGFIKAAGATTVVVAGGAVWRAFDQGVFSTGTGIAYKPWKNWRDETSDEPLSLVRAAILAASPHNSQPWLFRISPKQINLFSDYSRNIGSIDPLLREMHIGLGCALENLLLAAKAKGYAYQLHLFPDLNDSSHIAQINLTESKPEISDLYEAIPQRHTNRGLYDKTRQIPIEVLQSVQTLGNDMPELTLFWFTTELEKQRIGDLIIQATEAIIADKEQSADSAKWMRQNWQEIQQYKDGITLDAQSLSIIVRAVGKTLPPFTQEQNDAAWLQVTKETHISTAAAFGIVAVRDVNNNRQRIDGGRFWQRIHLWATTQGLALHPLNQLSERADRESTLDIKPKFGNDLREAINDTNWQALMAFRIGYPLLDSLPSPRRNVENVLIT
jgi:hypothetical protein